jgi:hypothetical protein
MNYRIIKILPIALFSIPIIFLNSGFAHAEDLVVQSKCLHKSAVLYNYNIGYEGYRDLSEIVPVDYNNALEKLRKQYQFLFKSKNMSINVFVNDIKSTTTYHNFPGLDYADLHPIIDNELALHPDSLGLIAAHDQISPLEWDDKVKQLSAKGMERLSYAEKFDLALALEYDDARVKRSEPLSERTKKADEILTALWNEDKQLIVWYARFGLYDEDKNYRLTNGEPELETKQECNKKESALYDELIAYSVGDTILDATKKARANGWKDGPLSTYNLSKSQLKYLLQFVNFKANYSRPLTLTVPEKSPAYQQIGRLNGFGDAAEYAYWKRWVKQIEAQMKEGNAAK